MFFALIDQAQLDFFPVICIPGGFVFVVAYIVDLVSDILCCFSMRCAEFICGMALSLALCSCGSQSTLAQVLPLVKLVVRAVAHSFWVPHRLTRTTKIVRGSAMAKRKAWWRCAERYVSIVSIVG